MKNTLIIVESPTKVKTIKKFLSSKYKVEATMGHIRDLPKSTLGIDVENHFQPKYITIRGKGDTLDKLKKEAKNADRILLATDPDREGEAISWHLASQLKIDEDSVCRIEFHEITKSAVTNAIHHPRRLDKNLIDAQQARRVLDRLVGYKMSPLLWKKVRKGLSAGRVQSVALRIICDRENEIQNFIPEEYWTILAKLQPEKEKGIFEAKFYGIDHKKTEIKNEEQAKGIVEDLKISEYFVENIKQSEKKRNSPFPFTTSSLQQEASKKLNFSTKKTMMVAQQLYEGVDIKGTGTVGLITYLRTDSVRISDEAKAEANDFIRNKYGEKYAGGGIKKQTTKKNVQDAHEAIRPTSILREPTEIEGSLSKDQLKLYRLIWNRFVASQMTPAVFDTISVDIVANQNKSGQRYLLKANGSKLKFSGFLKVYDDQENSKDILLPVLEEGQQLKLKKLEDKQHFTEPPSRYTEATLVKALEEKGIGRPSTYAPTISTILARGYVAKEKKMLKPTELGDMVIQLLIEYFPEVVNISFTAEMENQLDVVAAGKKDWVKVIDEFYEPFQKSLAVAEEVASKIQFEEKVSDVVCEFCGRQMVYKQGRYGEFLACPGFPECRNTKPIVVSTGFPCPKCGGDIIERKSKKNKKFYGCSNYPECDFTSWAEPMKEICPKCGAHLGKQKFHGKETMKCLNPDCDYEKKEKEES